MIHIKTDDEIAKIRESAAIVGKVLQEMKKITEPGITTHHLNKIAEEIIEGEGAKPGFKGFQGYPYTLCVSRNDIVLHGFPNNKPLKNGDVLKVDVGVLKNGYYGDAAVTIPVGRVTEKNKALIQCTKEALHKAIEIVTPKIPINYLSYAIQQHVESCGFNVIKSYGGHGIGKQLHEEPFIKNFTLNKNRGPLLQTNMVICIEPVATTGEDLEIMHRNGWSICMKDGSNTAHFEHQVLVTDHGAEILTRN